MPRPPRSQRPRVHKPSPLQQVTGPMTDPPPEMGLVRDPQFWKRFSTAVHLREEKVVVGDEEAGRSMRSNSESSGSGSVRSKYGDEWLKQQHKEKRRGRILCVSITLVVIFIIVVGAITAWYFTQARK